MPDQNKEKEGPALLSSRPPSRDVSNGAEEREGEGGERERERKVGRKTLRARTHADPSEPFVVDYHSTWMEAIDPGNRWICYVRARERSVILFSPFRFSGRRDRSNSSRARAARNTPGEKMPGEEEEEEEEVNEVLIYSSVGPSGPSFLSLGRDGWKHDRHLARGKAFPLYPG